MEIQITVVIKFIFIIITITINWRNQIILMIMNYSTILLLIISNQCLPKFSSEGSIVPKTDDGNVRNEIVVILYVPSN